MTRGTHTIFNDMLPLTMVGSADARQREALIKELRARPGHFIVTVDQLALRAKEKIPTRVLIVECGFFVAFMLLGVFIAYRGFSSLFSMIFS